MVLPLLAGVFTKAAVGKAILGTVGAAVVGGIQRKQAKKDLAEQRAYDEGALMRMRDAASRAGFNPLTALKAGALSSFNTPGRILPPGGAAFAAQYLGDAIGEAFDKKANEPIEKYNAEIRKLELEQRKADLSISKATLGQLNAPKKQMGATEVPVMDLDGKQMVDDEGQPLFMHAMNQEVQPMYIAVRNNTTGEVFAYPNPELADMGPTELATFFGMTGALSAHQKAGTNFSYKGYGLPQMPRFNWGTKFKDNRMLGKVSSAQ